MPRHAFHSQVEIMLYHHKNCEGVKENDDTFLKYLQKLLLQVIREKCDVAMKNKPIITSHNVYLWMQKHWFDHPYCAPRHRIHISHMSTYIARTTCHTWTGKSPPCQNISQCLISIEISHHLHITYSIIMHRLPIVYAYGFRGTNHTVGLV